jgi:hypothetical protein
MIGALIGLAFGVLWFLVGSNALGGPAGAAVACAGILLFAAAAVRAIRRRDQWQARPFKTAYYVAAVLAEMVAIAIAHYWLETHGNQALFLPVVGTIVGLHFIGLWLASGQRLFVWLSGAMVAINVAAIIAPLPPRGRQMVTGFGSSAALLVAASL